MLSKNPYRSDLLAPALLGSNRAQGMQKNLILFRCADGYPQTTGKQCMATIEILNQYTLFKQPCENLRR